VRYQQAARYDRANRRTSHKGGSVPRGSFFRRPPSCGSLALALQRPIWGLGLKSRLTCNKQWGLRQARGRERAQAGLRWALREHDGDLIMIDK